MSRRDRVIDVYNVVHFVDGTTMYMNTGHVFIKTLCNGDPLNIGYEKTSKQIPVTCFDCIDIEHAVRRWHENTRDVRIRRERR